MSDSEDFYYEILDQFDDFDCPGKIAAYNEKVMQVTQLKQSKEKEDEKPKVNDLVTSTHFIQRNFKFSFSHKTVKLLHTRNENNSSRQQLKSMSELL